jgi:hypothetical protein
VFFCSQIQATDSTHTGCNRKRAAAKQQAEQGGGGRVQQDVDEVIAERGVPPEPVLEPESRVEERVVLLRRPGLEPDAQESRPRLQGGMGDVAQVVPQEVPLQRRGIGNQRGEQEEPEDRTHHPAVRLGRGGVFGRARAARHGWRQGAGHDAASQCVYRRRGPVRVEKKPPPWRMAAMKGIFSRLD